jgi:hypothetical protein
MATSAWRERQLFGGAITCEVPSDWRDVSDVRQVPDHQEVYQDFSSARDACLIIEILGQEDGIEGEPAKFFFDDLVEANGSVESHFSATNEDLIRNPPPDCTMSAGVGIQKMHRGRDADYAGNPRELKFDYVTIELCVVRLQTFRADLLVTLSTTMPGRTETQNGFSDDFRRILATLSIRDFGIFGDGEE